MNRPSATAVRKWCGTLGVLVLLYVFLGLLESGVEGVRDAGVEELSRTWMLQGENWSAVLIRLVASLKLYVVSLILVGGFGIPLGVFAGGIRSLDLRRVFLFFFVVLISIPTIGLGFGGIYFAVEVLEMPVLRAAGGMEGGSDAGLWRRLLAGLWFVLLPAGVLAIPGIGKVAMAMRGAVEESMRCQSMIALTSRGLSRQRRLYRYALPASWGAALRAIGDVFPRLVGASIIVEWIFDYPGMGARGFEAILEGDARLLVMLAMILALLVLFWRLALELIESAAFGEGEDTGT